MNLKRYTNAINTSDLVEDAAFKEANRRARELVKEHDLHAAVADRLMTKCGPTMEDDCLMSDKRAAFRKLVIRTMRDQLLTLAAANEAFRKAHKSAVRDIDRSAVWTLVLNTTRQGVSFGPNRLGLGLRGLVGTKFWDHTVNLDWQRADWRGGQATANAAKLGYSAARLLSNDPGAESAPKVTLSLVAEKYKNVPGAKHDKVVKAGLRFDIPLTEGVTIPVMLNYASHTDLLTDQRLLSAHIAVAWDFSGLTKKATKE